MSEDQLAIVENVVTHQPIEKFGSIGAELSGLSSQLLERRGESMRNLHILAPERLDQLDVMITRHTERLTGAHHCHHQAQYVGRCGSTIHQIADKCQLAAIGRCYCELLFVALHLIPERRHQFQQLIQTTMHVADDVERAMLPTFVVP